MRFHAEVPLVSFLRLLPVFIALVFRILVGDGALMIVASTIALDRISRPFSVRMALMATNIRCVNSFFSTKRQNFSSVGKGRRIVHAINGSVLMDDLSHADMWIIFNRVERCISYDPYTMYSHFAALCGCNSIIIPAEGVTKEAWYSDPADSYGLGYGFEDIEEGRQTRPLLPPHLKQQESNDNESVRESVLKCKIYFP